MVASALLKNTISSKEWITTTTFIKERALYPEKKKKKQFPATKHITQK